MSGQHAASCAAMSRWRSICAPARPRRAPTSTRCLKRIAELDRSIGAFVTLNKDGAHQGRRRLDRALARRQAAVADRRHADRDQGHHRDRRHADRPGLAAVGGRRSRAAIPRACTRCARPAPSSSARPPPPNSPPPIRGTRPQNPHDAEPHAGRLVERLVPPRSAPAWCRRGSAPRWSARSCGRRASAARSASSRASARSTAAARTTISARAARARSARRWPTPGRCCAPSPTAPAAIRASSGLTGDVEFRQARQAGAARRARNRRLGRDHRRRAQGVRRGQGASSPRPASSCKGRADDPDIEAVEKAIADAQPLTLAINAWEGRWPLNTYADLDASKLSARRPRPAEDRRGDDAEAIQRTAGAARRGARGLCQGREPLRRLRDARRLRRGAGRASARPATPR